MTPKEQTRLQVLNSLLAEHITLEQAAELMGVSLRHARRILAAYQERGAAAIAHGLRGRRPTNTTPDAVAEDVVRLARTTYQGANHSHLSELLAEREDIIIGRTTLRRILGNAGLKSPRRRRPPKHRVRRQRMPQEGMLVQLDGSYHRWLGGDGPQFTLLIAVDDATGAVINALFCEQEDSHHYFLLIQGLLRRRGMPLALYADRHPVFKHKSEYQPSGTPTQFGRAMEELGIQLIFALSPQAKGRVERTAGTFQDRLITELRLAGAATMEEARAVLRQFLPRFNRRFQVPAQCSKPAFQPLQPDLRLDQVLCFKHRRRVARDNTVKFRKRTLQLLPSLERPSYAGAQVVVLQALDGRLSVQHDGCIIAAREAPPSPGALRKAEGTLPAAPVPVPDIGFPSPASANTPELENSPVGPEDLPNAAVGDTAMTELEVTTSPGKPTFLQRERWKAVQQAKLRGLSIRGMARELGIHRNTVRKYIDAESPPTRRSPIASTEAASGTISESAIDISPEQLNGHSP